MNISRVELLEGNICVIIIIAVGKFICVCVIKRRTMSLMVAASWLATKQRRHCRKSIDPTRRRAMDDMMLRLLRAWTVLVEVKLNGICHDTTTPPRRRIEEFVATKYFLLPSLRETQ